MSNLDFIFGMVIGAFIFFFVGRAWEAVNVEKYTKDGGYYELNSRVRVWCTVERMGWPSEMEK